MRDMKVLLIDDDDIFNFVHKRIIENVDSDIEVVVHNSCPKALDYLANCGDSFPDFIFLDINMPEMNGFEFLDSTSQLSQEIREKLKVFFVSSTLNDADVQKAHTYPMVIGFQDKPLNEAVITKLLTNK
jgi:CheY-like chemotaxis protein